MNRKSGARVALPGFAVVMTIAAAGCASSACLMGDALAYHDYCYYEGSRVDLMGPVQAIAKNGWAGAPLLLAWPLLLADLPLSFIADTILIPWSVSWPPEPSEPARPSLPPPAGAPPPSAPLEGAHAYVALEEDSSVLVLAASPDGERLAFGGAFGTRIASVGSGSCAVVASCAFAAENLAWSPDGRRLAVVDADGAVTILETAARCSATRRSRRKAPRSARRA